MGATVCIIARPAISLLPIRQKALLTHVIEKFAQDARFVIAVDGASAPVEEYLRMAHPGIDARVVGCERGVWRERNRWAGLLEGSFFCIEAESFFLDSPLDLAPSGDVLAVAPLPPGRADAVRIAWVEDREVIAVTDEPRNRRVGWRQVTGILRVESAMEFFAGFEKAERAGKEPSLIHGIEALARDRLTAQPIHDWVPIGSQEEYRRSAAILDPFDFPKSGEFLYRVGDRVIKYFEDAQIVANRLERARLRPEHFPEILASGRNFYSYRFCPGHTLYEAGTPLLLARLLAGLERSFWPLQTQVDLVGRCDRFYREKTHSRVSRYMERAGIDCDIPIVNGSRVPPTRALLDAVPWEWLSCGAPAFIHGDLQFDNVVYQPQEDRFTLIDWRQDFGGEIRAGDLHYDHAKLLAGCEIDFRRLKLRQIGIKESEGEIGFYVPAVDQVRAYRLVIQRSCERNGLDYRKVRMLAAIIYLNMAGLHFAPLDKLLFQVGRHQLAAELGLLEGEFRRSRFR